MTVRAGIGGVDVSSAVRRLIHRSYVAHANYRFARFVAAEQSNEDFSRK
jgi:hypothetical protein